MKTICLQLFLFTSLLCCSLTSYAQQLSLNGKLISESKEGVSFAAVGLMNLNDSSLAKTTVADENGDFNLNGLSKGDYFLVATSVGFKKYSSKKIALTTQSIKLPTIILKSNNVLKEVKVTAQKPLVEVLADKTVFNVEGTVAAIGSSGLETLRKAPGVVLDNKNNIMIEGKTGVQVYIDGKKSMLQGEALTNYLNSLQSSDIESIEIITQPSSKYEAAGTAGIINIKLKKNKGLGTNGTINVGYSVWHNNRINGGITLNNRTKKTNTFISYSNWFGANSSYENFTRQQRGYVVDAKSDDHYSGTDHNIRLGTDYFINDKHTIGVLLKSYTENGNLNSVSPSYIRREESNDVQEVLQTSITNTDNIYNLLGNLNYKYEDTLGYSFNADVDLGKYNSLENNRQFNTTYNGDQSEVLTQNNYQMRTPVKVDIFTAKVDYEQNLFKGKLGVGLKTSMVSTDNAFEFYNLAQNDINAQTRVFNEERSNTFDYTENIHAAYINYNKKWKKLNVQMGLRVENTVSDGKLSSTQEENNKRVKRNYTNLFPSGGLSYNHTKNHAFALNYSRRIQRPNYNTLNPFEWQINALVFRRRIAFLKPQYIDKIKLSHTYKSKLNTSVSYSFVDDFFAEATVALDERSTMIQTQNVATQKSWTFSLSLPQEITKWWETYLSINAYHQSFDSKTGDFSALTQNSLSAYTQNTFSLPKGYKLELSGWYNSPSVWGGAFTTAHQGAINIGAKKSFLDDKLSVKMALNDVFYTAPWTVKGTYGETTTHVNGGWESRRFSIKLSYNFGSNKIKSARSRKTAAEEENNRI